jgi:hypothetical protein
VLKEPKGVLQQVQQVLKVHKVDKEPKVLKEDKEPKVVRVQLVLKVL